MMFNLSMRLVGLSCKTLKRSIVIHSRIPSLESSAQITTLSNVRQVEVSNSQIEYLVSSLQKLGFNEDAVKSAVQNQPDLLKKSPAVWNSVLGSLLKSGMGKQDILSVLEKYPSIFSIKTSELDQNIETWFRCNLGTELTINILKTHPSLLQVNSATVESRVGKYRSYFESKKRVGKLLLSAPNTLIEDWDELFDKLNYLNELCTEKYDLVSTGVLAHSALHIRARHEFLIRAGVYKRPGKNFNRKLCKNPKLQDIVNTSDKEFAFKVAGLTLLEYEVFLEMYQKEIQEMNEHDYQSDDEDGFKQSPFAKHNKQSRRKNS